MAAKEIRATSASGSPVRAEETRGSTSSGSEGAGECASSVTMATKEFGGAEEGSSKGFMSPREASLTSEDARGPREGFMFSREGFMGPREGFMGSSERSMGSSERFMGPSEGWQNARLAGDGSGPKEGAGGAGLHQGTEDVPQGRHLGRFSTVVLFISRIIGSGIWAVPAGVFRGCGGSPLLFMAVWVAAGVSSVCGLFCFLELGSIIPRSGGTKVFLEFIYPRPKLLVSVVFGLFSVLFGVSLTNCLVFGKYFLYCLGFDEQYIDTTRTASYVGLALIVAVTFFHGVSVRHGVLVQNVLGALKLFLVLVMTLTGLYVLLAPSALTGLPSQLHWDPSLYRFHEGGSASVASVATALLQCFFTFSGWNNVHTVASEIHDPVRTMAFAGKASLLVVALNYLLINIAYLKVIPHDEIWRTGPLIGSVLFERLFGYRVGRQFVTVSIALSSASNVFVVTYAVSRMNQQVFREGYFPLSQLMASNYRHTNTPLCALLLTCVLTAAWLLALPPSGDAFNYYVSLEGYPQQLFLLMCAAGVFILRRRFPNERAPIHASLLGTACVVFTSGTIVLAPFVSPDSSIGRVSLLPPYHITACLVLLACALYWLNKFYALPHLLGYQLEPETLTLSDGLTVKHWKAVRQVPGYQAVPQALPQVTPEPSLV